MKKQILLLVTYLLFSQILSAQELTAGQYVARYKEIAIREMKRMGVPASISLAQGLLETENGNSDLVKRSNNHFGIKCKSTWTAETISHDDDAPGECFRVYKSAEDSYRDHSNFLRGSDRYAFLFKLDPRDYKGWAYGLRKAGYATNPKYPEILIKNIEDNNLEQYTDSAINEVPVFDASKYTDDIEDKQISEQSLPQTQNNPGNKDGITQIIINGKKALWVPKGTSLLAIATQNNINLNRLLEWNDITKDGLLEKDQYIFLEKKQKEGYRAFYILQGGETLYDAAQKNGIILQALYDYNHLSPGENIFPGTKIMLIPPSAINPISTRNGSPHPETDSGRYDVKIHEVQPRESLYAISRKYGVSVDQLREWNSLTGNNVKTGQQLIISK